MSTAPSNLIGNYFGRAEALENVVDCILPLLTPDQKEALATALTNLSLNPPEGTPQNWQYDPEYSAALDGVYQTLLVELWRES
ncbi:hypothetical protein GT347_09735 [Xylophilus rhododendri]|uniref:Uncharacterized protein n=1 Tax=Xylophilus rhododendri TaxID=2697032 RepID=A0A857J2T8_9BURK|nr:hypothetical protein [Xylophilus rhododendri]QHI98250.1 hypothetical protein GT347_09735 [Xylophilus rhododendri]